jgi:repressor LexA
VRTTGPARRWMILKFIRSFTLEYGYSPTVREIGQAVGLSSPSSVFEHLRTLAKQDLIHQEFSKPRTVRCTAKGLVA